MSAPPDTALPTHLALCPALHPATSGAAPPWRALAGLGAAVIAAHALVLQTAPTRWGPGRGAAPAEVSPLVMRRIAPEPLSAEVAAAAPAPAAPSVPTVRAAPTRPRPLRPPRDRPPAASAPPPAALAPGPVADQAPVSAAPIESIAAPTIASTSPEAPQPAETPAPAEPAQAVPQASASAPAPPAPDAPTPVTAMALPANTRLVYEATGRAKGLTYQARSELDWRQTGGQYEARIRISALFLGSRSMTSSGMVGATGLAPRRFADQSRTEQAAHFEPGKGQISFSANTPSLPWVPGAQDRVTVFLQLGGMLAGRPDAFPPGASISVYTVGPRDGQMWTFEVGREETLRLPFGEVLALKLTRQPRRDYDQKVEVWYAPALGYLPVRNKITQHTGDFVDQQLGAVAPY